MGVGTAQTAPEEHHGLVEKRTALFIDVAELMKQVTENAHLCLLDPTEFRDLSRLVAMMGEAVGFATDSRHMRHHVERGNIKRDAARGISLQGQPQQITHQPCLLHHLILVLDVGRLRVVHDRFRTLLPLTQPDQPRLEIANAGEILIEPHAVPGTGGLLEPVGLVEYEIEYAAPRLDPPQRGCLLRDGAFDE